jgi:hypothetical protein
VEDADLDRLDETAAILSDAATMRQRAESDAEIARGETASAEELAEAMRRGRASA